MTRRPMTPSHARPTSSRRSLIAAARSRSLGWCVGLLLACLIQPTTQVRASEPAVPPGLGLPGAIAIALLGHGIDYRLPELASRLARDGEGDLISWDFSDGDIRPFATEGPGTDAARLVARLAPRSQLIIVKERADPQAFGHMMAFAARTPARIVVWLDAHPSRRDWPILGEAVRRFGDRIFIVQWPAGAPEPDKDPVFATLRSAPNAVLVAEATAVAPAQADPLPAAVTVSDSDLAAPLAPSQKATLVIAALAGRALATDARRSMADLKYLLTQAAAEGVAIRAGALTLARAHPAFDIK